jgi:hypothetical protein
VNAPLIGHQVIADSIRASCTVCDWSGAGEDPTALAESHTRWSRHTTLVSHVDVSRCFVLEPPKEPAP